MIGGNQMENCYWMKYIQILNSQIMKEIFKKGKPQ